ncbi:alpha/beta fold hydrolase [Rhodanobacter umsongensis]
MMTQVEAELPCHFGANGELFGIYHPAPAPATKAVLLCPPFGQELVRSHRLYRQLAHALVAQGIAVLRFDYYGSGDSAGRSMDVDWSRCIDDALAATDELRALGRCDRVAAFGARLGGSVALAVAAAARLAELVVWDPVLDGATHVARLDTLQATLQHDTKRFTRPRAGTDIAGQWLGFAVGAHFRQQLVDLHLDPPTIPTLLLDSLPATSTHDWTRLAATDMTVTPLQPPTPWDDLDRLELAILSHELIRTVCSHLRETR